MDRKDDEYANTLSDEPSTSWPSSSSGDAGSPLQRYTLGAVLGVGGMGEVVSARDEQIGRSVAIKRLRAKAPTSEALGRFLREAKIQGRLEHPAIVPVHEVGYDDHRQPFFVMKQLMGTTLADVLVKLAAGDAATAAKFSRQRLLRAFADVCLAIEFAHTRSVIHRDLKPSNIVLGDFGEVYVIDWGIARVANETGERPSFNDIETMEGTETVVGTILGTPGYISPEQIRGDTDLDGRADVYSLGAILFEILAHEPLHPHGSAALASALAGIDARPSARGHDVPPELEAICVRATLVERDERYATARELGDAIERFLDGDRDIVVRKSLAGKELSIASEALAKGNDAQSRRTAIRAAARALALDPTAREPVELVGRLMLEPPKQVPKEVESEIERLDLEALRGSTRDGILAALAYLLFFPILYWIGFRDTWYIVVGTAICAFIAFTVWVVAPRNPFLSGYLSIAGHLLMFMLLSRVVTPFVFGTGPAVIMVMLLAPYRRLIATWLLALLAGMAVLLPWMLELVGVLPPTVFIEGHSLILQHSAADHLDRAGMFGSYILYVFLLLALGAILSRGEDDARQRERRTIQIQSWQLRQLI